VFEEQEVPYDLSEERPLPRRNPTRREDRIQRDRSPVGEFRPRKWGRAQYSPEPDLTLRRELKMDRARNKPSQQASSSSTIPMVVEAPSPNSAEPIIEEPEDMEPGDQLFTPGSQRITKKPRRRPAIKNANRLPITNTNKEIAIRHVPIEVDYHFITPGASAMLGDPRAIYDDMPTKKRRMEYNIEMPSAYSSQPLAAGPSQPQVAGLSRRAIGTSNQNVALPAPKSMAAITGPKGPGPIRLTDRRSQLAIEMTPEYQPEYQVALREMQEMVPKKTKKPKVKKPY
jgi:hypothetical protein